MNSIDTLPQAPMVSLTQRFKQLRAQTRQLAAPLSEADMTIQGAEFASPTKWHLAHTTWFFEAFFLGRIADYRVYSEQYHYLFNSYYDHVGARHQQGLRGLITRPTLREVLDYRQHVENAVVECLKCGVDEDAQAIIELGIQHEQQHQELLMTDILFNLSCNPLLPAYRESSKPTHSASPGRHHEMTAFDGGLIQIGHAGDAFGFDNEFPRHLHYLEPFKLSRQLVTNRDWINFIEDGGYQNSLLWLSDGWKIVRAENWTMPLYWQQRDGYQSFTLGGLRPLNLAAPVTHISFFEADAYARWAGKRLPTEAEWERVASSQTIAGNFAESGIFQPQPALSVADNEFSQMFGDVWEWTASPYVGYPGFKTSEGAIGEYNGKFMNGQYVLRGGSCVTPKSHIRATYRNFFYPQQRWQFTGLRLAENEPARAI